MSTPLSAPLISTPADPVDRIDRVDLEHAVGGPPIIAGAISERGTFLQRSGVQLFLVVMAMTLVTLVGLFVYVVAATPALPGPAELRAPGDTAVVRLIAAERQAVFANFITGVKEIVVAFFPPLITGLLGYIFGNRAERSSDSR